MNLEAGTRVDVVVRVGPWPASEPRRGTVLRCEPDPAVRGLCEQYHYLVEFDQSLPVDDWSGHRGQDESHRRRWCMWECTFQVSLLELMAEAAQ